MSTSRNNIAVIALTAMAFLMSLVLFSVVHDFGSRYTFCQRRYTTSWDKTKIKIRRFVRLSRKRQLCCSIQLRTINMYCTSRVRKALLQHSIVHTVCICTVHLQILPMRSQNLIMMASRKNMWKKAPRSLA